MGSQDFWGISCVNGKYLGQIYLMEMLGEKVYAGGWEGGELAEILLG